MQVACPTCQKTVEWNASARWRPFCSKRCRLIDLGDWFDERHRIPDTEPGRDPANGDESSGDR